MRTYEKCFKCFEKQAERTAKLATSDADIHNKIMLLVKDYLQTVSMESTPPEIADHIYKIIADVSGNPDPYQAIKQQNIEKVKSLYPALKQKLSESDNQLEMAVRLAIAGNVIDYGLEKVMDIEQAIEEKLTQDFAIFDFEKFRDKLDKAEFILYLADNSGEAVLDKLLIETMGKKTVFAVKEKPVINDATLHEAEMAGMSDIAKVISSGSTAPGTLLSLCSPEFMDIFNRAPMIISKGQGNFEALSEVDAPIFFLLKAKCPVIAKDLDVEVNDIILKSQL